MSNTWFYRLIFRGAVAAPAETLSAALETADTFGYSVGWPPDRGSDRATIPVMHYDGMEESTFTDLDSAKAFLCSEGGFITLFKERGLEVYSDIGLTYAPRSGHITVSINRDVNPDVRWRYSPADVDNALELERLFCALCRQLEPLYGYSTDEHRLEALLYGSDFQREWTDFEAAVANLQQPPILFWLNYFSAFYLDRIGRLWLDSTPHRAVPAEQGLFVYLADHPWKAQLGKLQPGGGYRLTHFL